MVERERSWLAEPPSAATLGGEKQDRMGRLEDFNQVPGLSGPTIRIHSPTLAHRCRQIAFGTGDPSWIILVAASVGNFEAKQQSRGCHERRHEHDIRGLQRQGGGGTTGRGLLQGGGGGPGRVG